MNPTASRRAFLKAAASCAAVTPALGAAAAADPIGVVVWDERQPAQREAYENFLGNAIADHLRAQPGLSVQSVALDDPEQGLPESVLGSCRVLVWWGHARQAEVKPEVGRKLVERIKAGTLSLIALHSAHWSTPFMEAMNERARLDLARDLTALRPADVTEVPPPQRYTLPKFDSRLTPYSQQRKFPGGATGAELHLPFCCFPAYRNDGKPSSLHVTRPDHPIVGGLPARFEIPREEMYCEPFHVPEPDAVLIEERWATGEWFRSAMLWQLGKGKVVYFRPGHETYPTYKQPEPLRVLSNAVRWLGA